MYNELKQMILNRLGTTTDITGYYEGTAGVGMYGWALETHQTLKIKRKIANLFTCEFIYEDGNYTENPYIRPRKSVYASFCNNDSEYKSGGGQQQTAIMLCHAHEFAEEELIADIMIAAAFREVISLVKKRGYYKYSKDYEAYPGYRIITEIVENAEKTLVENKYQLWTPATKYFVFGSEYRIISDFVENVMSLPDVSVKNLYNYVFDIFKWFLDENCYICVARLHEPSFKFAILEKNIMEYRTFIDDNMMVIKKDVNYIQYIEDNYHMFNDAINSFNSDFLLPARLENTKRVMKEISEIISELNIPIVNL